LRRCHPEVGARTFDVLNDALPNGARRLVAEIQQERDPKKVGARKAAFAIRATHDAVNPLSRIG